MKQFWFYFKNGIIGENPVLRLMIGLCSVLAVSVKVENCLAMGAAVIFVLTCSSIVIYFTKSTLTKLEFQFLLWLFQLLPPLSICYESLSTTFIQSHGGFIPLIVVNCIIMARAEAFAPESRSSFDSRCFGNGI